MNLYVKSRKFIFIIPVLILSLLFPTAASAAEYDASKEIVRVGFFALDGYHNIDEAGDYSGYGYDFLALANRYINVRYNFVGYENSREDMQKMLENGDIDLLTAVFKTPETEAKFDFSKPIGRSSAILTIRSDNQSIIPQDYTTYNNIRIALLAGNKRNADLTEFAEDNGFSYQPVYFYNDSEMSEALRNGTVDAILTSDLRCAKNEKIIDHFANTDFYAIVKKGNTELLDKINYAIDQMNAVEGDWKNELRSRYFEDYERYIAFTDEEMAIIEKYNSQDTPLAVVCDPTRYPYSYVEDGEVKGILPDYFRELAAYAGLSYEFIACKDRAEFIEYEKDEIPILFLDGRITSTGLLEDKGVIFSAPYITMRIAMVTRIDFDGTINVVSTVDQSLVQSIEDTYVSDAEKLLCENREAAMQAVLDGKADATFVYYYMAQEFVNRDQSGRLVYSFLEEPTYEYCIAVGNHVDSTISGILTKSIYAMPDNLVEEIATKYTSHKADLSFVTMLRLHPQMVIVITLIIILLIVFLVIMISRVKARARMQDIAQHRAEEMTALAEQAQSANIAKSRFLSNMSHDIRTPMNAIIGFTNIALRNNPEPDIKNCLEKIRESSDHLLSLINNILDFSRIESGKVKYEPVPVNIESVAEQAASIVRGSITQRDIAFSVRCEKPEYPYVLADEMRIKEVLINILGNAIKYTEDGGKIALDVSYHPSADSKHIVVRYVVADNGIGMSEEFTNHIFEEFVQEHTDARTNYSGTGLGMAITKRFVDIMGGTITVESKEGYGSVFTVELPLEITEKPESAPEQESRTISEKTDLTGVRVLMAEDNELNAEIASIQLGDAGMQVTHAADGQEVVEIFAANPKGTFDIILMDIMMPKLNGYEAAKVIRAMSDRPDAKKIPIVAMTANAFAEDVRQSVDAGMNAHLSKPIVMEEVTKTISRLIR